MSDVPLREYTDRRLQDLELRLLSIGEHTSKAVELADKNLLARLEHMNEFRAQILSERGNFISRESHEAHCEQERAADAAVERRLRDIENWQAKVFGALILLAVLGIFNFVRMLVR